jgi:CRP-like cAMP-binding protein
MKTIDDLLAVHEFFRDLEPDYRALVAGCGSNTVFEDEQYLFRTGAPADRFYAVRDGRVALEAFAPDRGPLVVETVGPGDVIGWSWLFPPYEWTFDARAVGQVKAVSFDGACLRAKCEQDHSLGWVLAKRFSYVMVRRLQSARLSLLDLYGHPQPGA